MAPTTTTPLSPAELSYLHTSLSQSLPIRPDGRGATQFRPLVAETDILPNANGSARICFSDGTEAVVGVKAEVERSDAVFARGIEDGLMADLRAADDEDGEGAQEKLRGVRGKDRWVEIAVELPGYREDDALPVFLSQMLGEGLMASGSLRDRLWINARFHWKLYIDILLLSPPTSYPLPLLSLTMHLALLSARLPRLISEGDEDPLFDDDWEASTYLYPFQRSGGRARTHKPPVTLLVALVGENVLFDPSKEELAAAEGVLALSAMESASSSQVGGKAPEGGVMLGVEHTTPSIQLLAIRTIDPPSRLTPVGVSNTVNPATGVAPASKADDEGVWAPPRGGIKRGMIAKVVRSVVEPGGVAQEVMEGLEAFAKG